LTPCIRIMAKQRQAVMIATGNACGLLERNTTLVI
jgi:hypothetical protein